MEKSLFLSNFASILSPISIFAYARKHCNRILKDPWQKSILNSRKILETEMYVTSLGAALIRNQYQSIVTIVTFLTLVTFMLCMLRML